MLAVRIADAAVEVREGVVGASPMVPGEAESETVRRGSVTSLLRRAKE
jgi:hypothetical protein